MLTTKKYIRKTPTSTFSLSSDVSTLIDSLSITIGRSKSAIVEDIFEMVLATFDMEEIIDWLTRKK